MTSFNNMSSASCRAEELERVVEWAEKANSRYTDVRADHNNSATSYVYGQHVKQQAVAIEKKPFSSKQSSSPNSVDVEFGK